MKKSFRINKNKKKIIDPFLRSNGIYLNSLLSISIINFPSGTLPLYFREERSSIKRINQNLTKTNTYGVEPDDGTVCLIVFSMLLSEYNPIGELNCLCAT